MSVIKRWYNFGSAYFRLKMILLHLKLNPSFSYNITPLRPKRTTSVRDLFSIFLTYLVNVMSEQLVE